MLSNPDHVTIAVALRLRSSHTVNGQRLALGIVLLAAVPLPVAPRRAA